MSGTSYAAVAANQGQQHHPPVIRSEDHPASPYYLHPNENPALILVSAPLTGTNYHSWARSMRMALLCKNKLKFIDGSIIMPSNTDPLFAYWERCNTMVLSWLIRSVSNSIAQSVIWLDSAEEVWRDLEERFAQGDSFRISDLQEEISTYRQGVLIVSDYYTHLKMM